LSINDAGSYGAIQALEEAGIPPEDVFIASVDAEQRAVNHIRQGYYIIGSLTVGRQATAFSAADITVQMLAGARVPQTITIPGGNVITVEDLERQT